jgi:hypothetical protein
MMLLDPRRHAPLRAGGTPAPSPPASRGEGLLSLAGGGRGWTSAGVSVVVRPGATAKELREAAAMLAEAADA